jgi:hypothetical protein
MVVDQCDKPELLVRVEAQRVPTVYGHAMIDGVWCSLGPKGPESYNQHVYTYRLEDTLVSDRYSYLAKVNSAKAMFFLSRYKGAGPWLVEIKAPLGHIHVELPSAFVPWRVSEETASRYERM